MPTKHISFHIAMIPVQSIYDKNSMKSSSNILKSINIVKYQMHRYDTHNSYAWTTSITTFFMDIITYYQRTMRLSKTSKQIIQSIFDDHVVHLCDVLFMRKEEVLLCDPISFNITTNLLGISYVIPYRRFDIDQLQT